MYIGLLFFSIVQNVCAMELDPLAMMLKCDDKCKMVAKYLHKYPAGRNATEAVRIKQFLNDKTPSRAALSRSVNRYKNMLQNIEAEEVLHQMHAINVPIELKQKIFTQVLWGYAQQYYAFYNTCKFVCMEKRLIPAHFPNWPSLYYIPYFFAEIQERDDQYFLFYKAKLPRPKIPLSDDCPFQSLGQPEFCNYNDDRILYSNFYNHRTYYSNKLKMNLFCYTKTLHGMSLESEEGIVRNLVFFVGIKKLRVLAFKQLFNKSIEDLARINGKEGVNAFIESLTLYKQLPRTIASMYEHELRQSVSIMLDDLPSMYERVAHKKVH